MSVPQPVSRSPRFTVAAAAPADVSTQALGIASELTAVLERSKALTAASAIEVACSLLRVATSYNALSGPEKHAVLVNAVQASSILSAAEKDVLVLCMNSMPHAVVTVVEVQVQSTWQWLKQAVRRWFCWPATAVAAADLGHSVRVDTSVQHSRYITLSPLSMGHLRVGPGGQPGLE